MNLRRSVGAGFLLSLWLPLGVHSQGIPWHDPSPHTIQFVTVDKNVKLEVLDWGGSGRALVLLAGLESTAHIFDDFALKLTPQYHVYGITRRGYGASSVPATGYSADRLGDDVLAVLDALKLDHPVLVGHSIGGEELSSVGTRHPERVAALIYLDAGYSYAYYDPSRGDVTVDSADLQRKLEQMTDGSPRQLPLIQSLLKNDLPQFERDLQEMEANFGPNPPAPPGPTAADLASFSAWRSWIKRTQGISVPEADLRQRTESNPDGSVGKPRSPPSISRAIGAGEQKYTNIPVPVLAIFAEPHDLRAYIAAPAVATFEAKDAARTQAQVKAFETGVPSAHVVRLPHANHAVFLSNEADVLREMNAFISGLP